MSLDGATALSHLALTLVPQYHVDRERPVPWRATADPDMLGSVLVERRLGFTFCRLSFLGSIKIAHYSALTRRGLGDRQDMFENETYPAAVAFSLARISASRTCGARDRT